MLKNGSVMSINLNDSLKFSYAFCYTYDRTLIHLGPYFSLCYFIFIEFQLMRYAFNDFALYYQTKTSIVL